MSDWGKPGELRKLFVELCAYFMPLLLVIMEWAERENGHRPPREGFPVPRQESECVLVPMEHEKRRPQHDRAVSFEGPYFSQGLNIRLQSAFSQPLRDCPCNFLRRAVARGISHKN